MSKDKKFAQMKAKEEIKRTLDAYCEKGGHRLPQSRREFLASGLLSLSATVMAPTLHGMLLNRAHAQGSCASSDATLPPFIQISLAGGAALCANFVAGDEKGNLLSSYKRMGLGLKPNVTRVFSNQAPFATGSGFLTGLTRHANPQTLGKSSFCSMAAFSFDDTADNEQNIVGLVTAAGSNGQYLPTTLTSSQVREQGQIQVSNARYFTTPAFIEPSSPLRVNSVSSIVESLTLQAPSIATATQQLTQSQAAYQGLFDLIGELSSSQLKKFQSRTPSSEDFKNLMACAHEKNSSFVKNGTQLPNLDVAKDGNLTNLWLQADQKEKNQLLGSVVLSTLRKISGPAFIQLGGYDYHQGAGSRQNSNQMDLFAGELVGRILQTAALLNTPVFIYINSDGSTFSPESESNTVGFSGDRATHGMSFMIGYQPTSAPEISAPSGHPSYQLNHFDAVGLECNTSHMVGKNVPLSSAAAFVNYLSFANRLNVLNSNRQLQNVASALNEAGSVEDVLRFRG